MIRQGIIDTRALAKVWVVEIPSQAHLVACLLLHSHRPRAIYLMRRTKGNQKACGPPYSRRRDQRLLILNSKNIRVSHVSS